MANNPTVGIFLPGGYLNNYNTANDTGASDAYGNIYPTGSNVGKMIEVGDLLAANLTTPGTGGGGTYATPSGLPLFGGAYQVVQVDSSATAANVVYGAPAYIRLDSGPTQGALPETSYQNIVVTTPDIVNQVGGTFNLFAGVFLNAVTPGNFGIIFVGAGRAAVTIDATNAGGGTGIGTPILTHAATPNFITAATTTTAVVPANVGIAVQAVTNGTYNVAYFPNIFYRLPGV